MRLKVQTVINGVAQTIHIDPNKDWIGIQFTQMELQMLSQWKANEVFIAAPVAQLKGNGSEIRKWALEWPMQFFSGSHRAPGGALLLPDNHVKDQNGN